MMKRINSTAFPKDIEQCTERISNTGSDDFGRVREQASQWNDGDGIHREDNLGLQVYKLDYDTKRHEDEQDVDPAVGKGILGVGDESEGSVLDTGRRIERTLLGSYGGRRLSISRGINAAMLDICGIVVWRDGLLMVAAVVAVGGAGRTTRRVAAT